MKTKKEKSDNQVYLFTTSKSDKIDNYLYN